MHFLLITESSIASFGFFSCLNVERAVVRLKVAAAGWSVVLDRKEPDFFSFDTCNPKV